MKKLIVATNLTDLHKGPSFLDELFTQLVNGAEVEVLEETNDKWLRVREETGYEGYAYLPYLAEAEKPVATHITHIAAALYNQRHSRDSVFHAVTQLPLGTPVRIEELRDRWARIQPAGNMLPSGWINSAFLRELSKFPLSPDDARKEIISSAQGFTGVYYLWGANSHWGTDCSGLAMMTHRLAGYTLPRDAWMQHRDAKKIETAKEGDLFFFHNDARTKIGHVGICTGGWNMIHSSRARNGVYEENIQQNPNLMSSFAGAGTFL